MRSAKPHEIIPGVYCLGSSLVNWYLVDDGGSLTAVDAGLPGFAPQLEEDLGTLGFQLADIKAVVLTHSDADHTGIAPQLREAGARVLIHAADEDSLSRPRPKQGDASPIHLIPRLWNPQLWRLMAHLMRAGAAAPARVRDAESFTDRKLLDVPGRPRVVHTPGHTPGHCVLHFENHGALFVGDAFCTWNPLRRMSGPQVMPTPFNVNTEECFDSLSAIEGLQAKVVLPGHGEPFHEGPDVAVARARAAGRS